MFLKLYRRLISPFHHLLGRSLFGSGYACRYSPTCSAYAATAIRKYGIIHGSVLGIKRLFRCHPYSNSPHLDPVPPACKS
ncbi:MAG TPA: membrane protein insertion efficiency factor YidD [Patescibacteria group bacterium]|nr:membrane protein insertion efficiency factor YidD [Patescibacteria group bacterium]